MAAILDRTLHLRLPLAEIIEGQQKTNNIQLLPVALEHVLALQRLPAYHRDPFDRLLIAQAICEELTIISPDATVHSYPVRALW